MSNAFNHSWGVVKDDGQTYKIIRHYFSDNKTNRVIKRGLTLEQAQAHCQDPSTHLTEEMGEPDPEKWWFDGYTED